MRWSSADQPGAGGKVRGTTDPNSSVQMVVDPLIGNIAHAWPHALMYTPVTEHLLYCSVTGWLFGTYLLGAQLWPETSLQSQATPCAISSRDTNRSCHSAPRPGMPGSRARKRSPFVPPPASSRHARSRRAMDAGAGTGKPTAGARASSAPPTWASRSVFRCNGCRRWQRCWRVRGQDRMGSPYQRMEHVP